MHSHVAELPRHIKYRDGGTTESRIGERVAEPSNQRVVHHSYTVIGELQPVLPGVGDAYRVDCMSGLFILDETCVSAMW
jgi:hypothetical protein